MNGIEELKKQTGGTCTDYALSECLKNVDYRSKKIEDNQVIIDGLKTDNIKLKGDLTVCLEQK